MGFMAKWRIHRQVVSHGKVEVSEKGGLRTLHLGSETVQSVMRLGDPHGLEVAYTRAMMAFLLFVPAPRDILQVGLGGGSMAKWLHRHVPEARDTVVEIHPEVVSVAQQYFDLPPEDERLRIVIGEGAEYVANHPQSCDVLLVDGYGSHGQAASLGTRLFYDSARRALKPGGVFVVNLWGSDRFFGTYVDRIHLAFDGTFLLLPAQPKQNVVAFGFERSPGMPKWEDLRARARELESRYGLEFLRFVEGFRKLNLHNERRLLV